MSERGMPPTLFATREAAQRYIDASRLDCVPILMADGWHVVSPEYTNNHETGAYATYAVKDSGARQTFDSGMVRDTATDKPRYDLVFDGPMLERLAVHLTKGAQKYEARNWMKANSWEEQQRFRESAARHFFQWMNGKVDEDHAAAIIFNLMGYMYLEGKKL